VKKKYLIMLLIFIFLSSLFCLPWLAVGKTIEFDCKYPKYSDKESANKTQDFNLTFLIDTITKKAYMKGNNGIADLMLIKMDSEGYSLIEITATGNVMTTAIDTNLDSVHSRNSIIIGKLTPTQNYGTCKIKK